MESIKIVQHNVLHWNTRKWELTHIYRTLDPDLILVNSHGVRDCESIKISGYTTYKINTSNEHNDGSAILVRQIIKHTIDDTFISDVLCVRVKTTTGPINIATTYLPPRRPYLPYPDIHKLMYSNDPTYIIADFNAKHIFLGNRTSNEVGKGLNIFYQNNKLIHLGPNFPTFFNINSASTPDLVLCNNKTFHNHKIEQGPLSSSDHLPIILTITSKAITEAVPPRLLMTNTNWDNFRKTVEEKLLVQTEEREEPIERIDGMLDRWYSAIKEGITKNIPITKVKIVNKAITNRDIVLLQRQFYMLNNNAARYGWTRQDYAEYRRLKQQITIESRRQQEREWEKEITLLTNTHNNPNLFWSKIKALKVSTNSNPSYILSNNTKIYEDREKEIIFRNIWKNVFRISEEENEEFDTDNENRVHEYLRQNIKRTLPYDTLWPTRCSETNFVASAIKEWEVRRIIKKMKNNAPGQSGINKTILTELPDMAITKLNDIFNAALSLGYFPDKFKIGTIHLIPKGNKSPLNPINYRPITLLEVPGKIFERTINNRLRKHLHDNNLLPPEQHGFRAQRGTATAIALTTEIIAQTLSRKNHCHLVLRDVTKAFDKVWHEGLKYKILQLNLPGHLERLLCDYLSDRVANIRLKNVTGPDFEILSGVPQGGILSPTLYTIYIRDIPSPAIDSYNIMYADDITQIITYRGKSRMMMAAKVGNEIEKINLFEKKWKIKTNQTKFTLIPLAKNKNEDVIANGELIEFAKEGTILGLKTTSSGYGGHVKNIIQRGNQALGELWRFKNLPEKIKLHLIKAYVFPVLVYPTIPLAGLGSTSMRKIQRVQNKALRFAFNEHYPYNRNTRQLHEEGRVKPINITLYDRARQIWEKLESLEDPLFTVIKDNPIISSHAWFPSTIHILDGAAPLPLYT